MGKEVKLIFKNYKLLKEGEFNLSDGSVFFIQGPNKAGKTSFVNALKAIMEAKDETVNPTSFGEKEGYILGTIPGADGQQYQFRYDYNVEGKRKFSFIGPDGKSIKSVTEMRAIFKYTHFTAEEFYSWSLDAKGRAKQKEILMKLLSEKEQKEITDIDAMINVSSGTKFLQRQNINREVDGLKLIVEKGLNLSVDESKYWNQKEDIKKQFETVKAEKEEIDNFMSNIESSLTLYNSSLKAKETIYNNFETSTRSNNDVISDIDKQIEQLKLRREEYVKKNHELEIKYNNEIEEINNEIEHYSKAIDKDKLEKYKAAYDDIIDEDTGEVKKKGIKTRFIIGSTIMDTIKSIEEREKILNDNKLMYEKKLEQAKQITDEIETLRKRKTDIVKNSDSIPHEFEIGDDYITVDNVPFVETDLCKSSAIKAVAKLMIKINDAPVMLMGDAEQLGYPVLNELKEFAEANNKIMVFAEHVRTLDEMKLVCYDDIEHEKPKETGELF